MYKGLDYDDNHLFKTKTESGYTVEIRISEEDDWGKGRPNPSLACNIELMVSKKRKNMSDSLFGEITGPGGFEVYLATKEAVEEAIELWSAGIIGNEFDKTMRLYACGYNSRLDQAYRKILPRLGFSPSYRGIKAMEMIIDRDLDILKFDYTK